MTAMTDTTSPDQATARARRRTPPYRSASRVVQNSTMTNAATAAALSVAPSSIVSGRLRAAPLPSRSSMSTSGACGESVRRQASGRGTSCRSGQQRHAKSAASSARDPGRARRGRMKNAARATTTAAGASVHAYAPPNANSVQTSAAALSPGAAPGVERLAARGSAVETTPDVCRALRLGGFGVVVLVLVTVVARVVVLV